jgi:hydroquinone glucosyltransferase
VPRYVFYTSSLISLANFLYTPELTQGTPPASVATSWLELVLLMEFMPLRDVDFHRAHLGSHEPHVHLHGRQGQKGIHYIYTDYFVIDTFDGMEHETLLAFKELSNKVVDTLFVHAVRAFADLMWPDIGNITFW